MNKGLKGDLRTFAKIMEIANKLGIADTFISEQEKAEIKRAREETFRELGALLDKIPPQDGEITHDEEKEPR